MKQNYVFPVCYKVANIERPEAYMAQVIGSENLSGTKAKAAASSLHIHQQSNGLSDSSPGLLQLLEINLRAATVVSAY